MTEEKNILEGLSEYELKVLPFLDQSKTVEKLVQISGIEEIKIMRALQWLSNKNLVEIVSTPKELVTLDSTCGASYVKDRLPEVRILNILKTKGPKKISEFIGMKDLEEKTIFEAIGILKIHSAIEIKEGFLHLTEKGIVLLKEDNWPEEKLLDKLGISSKFRDDLTKDENTAVDTLKKRKGCIKIDIKNLKLVNPDEICRKLALQIRNKSTNYSNEKLIESLTPEMLKTGSWIDKTFRRYDIKADLPKIFGGRKQHYRTFQDQVRRKFIGLGFTEMSGPIVETDFWNMDALFMPQFHSARDIHDAYYIKDQEYAKDLPKEIVDRVKRAHENGYNTGSRGWEYKFDLKRTRRQLLRTHDTAISPRTLSSPQLKIPGKYFQMVRCFRYDVIDATHLADFNQVGGFVIEEGLNFKHLKGVLKMFAEEFAQCDQIKIKPSYFPFTEPSAELLAKHPDLGWIELGGSGIFRPELTKPLGIDLPVIAWGMGVDRIGMFNMGIKDIRDLFSHDLNFLRNIKSL